MTSPPDIVDREGICTGGVADVDAKAYVNGTADVDCNGRGIVATRIQYKQYINIDINCEIKF